MEVIPVFRSKDLALKCWEVLRSSAELQACLHSEQALCCRDVEFVVRQGRYKLGQKLI